MELVVTTNGAVRLIYEESLNLHAVGRVIIRRGSHVEPDGRGDWYANLAPVSGPVLGPFHFRSSALAAEAAWLREHWLTQPATD